MSPIHSRLNLINSQLFKDIIFNEFTFMRLISRKVRMKRRQYFNAFLRNRISSSASRFHDRRAYVLFVYWCLTRYFKTGMKAFLCFKSKTFWSRLLGLALDKHLRFKFVRHSLKWYFLSFYIKIRSNLRNLYYIYLRFNKLNFFISKSVTNVVSLFFRKPVYLMDFKNNGLFISSVCNVGHRYLFSNAKVFVKRQFFRRWRNYQNLWFLKRSYRKKRILWWVTRVKMRNVVGNALSLPTILGHSSFFSSFYMQKRLILLNDLWVLYKIPLIKKLHFDMVRFTGLNRIVRLYNRSKIYKRFISKRRSWVWRIRWKRFNTATSKVFSFVVRKKFFFTIRKTSNGYPFVYAVSGFLPKQAYYYNYRDFFIRDRLRNKWKRYRVVKRNTMALTSPHINIFSWEAKLPGFISRPIGFRRRRFIYSFFVMLPNKHTYGALWLLFCSKFTKKSLLASIKHSAYNSMQRYLQFSRRRSNIRVWNKANYFVTTNRMLYKTSFKLTKPSSGLFITKNSKLKRLDSFIPQQLKKRSSPPLNWRAWHSRFVLLRKVFVRKNFKKFIILHPKYKSLSRTNNRNVFFKSLSHFLGLLQSFYFIQGKFQLFNKSNILLFLLFSQFLTDYSHKNSFLFLLNAMECTSISSANFLFSTSFYKQILTLKWVFGFKSFLYTSFRRFKNKRNLRLLDRFGKMAVIGKPQAIPAHMFLTKTFAYKLRRSWSTFELLYKFRTFFYNRLLTSLLFYKINFILFNSGLNISVKRFINLSEKIYKVVSLNHSNISTFLSFIYNFSFIFYRRKKISFLQGTTLSTLISFSSRRVKNVIMLFRNIRNSFYINFFKSKRSMNVLFIYLFRVLSFNLFLVCKMFLYKYKTFSLWLPFVSRYKFSNKQVGLIKSFIFRSKYRYTLYLLFNSYSMTEAWRRSLRLLYNLFVSSGFAYFFNLGNVFMFINLLTVFSGISLNWVGHFMLKQYFRFTLTLFFEYRNLFQMWRFRSLKFYTKRKHFLYQKIAIRRKLRLYNTLRFRYKFFLFSNFSNETRLKYKILFHTKAVKAGILSRFSLSSIVVLSIFLKGLFFYPNIWFASIPLFLFLDKVYLTTKTGSSSIFTHTLLYNLLLNMVYLPFFVIWGFNIDHLFLYWKKIIYDRLYMFSFGGVVKSVQNSYLINNKVEPVSLRLKLYTFLRSYISRFKGYMWSNLLGWSFFFKLFASRIRFAKVLLLRYSRFFSLVINIYFVKLFRFNSKVTYNCSFRQNTYVQRRVNFGIKSTLQVPLRIWNSIRLFFWKIFNKTFLWLEGSYILHPFLPFFLINLSTIAMLLLLVRFFYKFNNYLFKSLQTVQSFISISTFNFNIKLDSKVPFSLKSQKSLSSWVNIETRDKRVLKDGGWVKRKTGKKRLRKIRSNSKKLLMGTRLYIWKSRQAGFTVDITNSLLNFFRFKVQRAFHNKKVYFFLMQAFSDFLLSLSFIESFKVFNILCKQQFIFNPLRSVSVYKSFYMRSYVNNSKVNLWSSYMALRRILYTKNFISVLWSGSLFNNVHVNKNLKKTRIFSNYVLPLISSRINPNMHIYLYSVIFRKNFRKLKRFARRFHKKIVFYKHLYDPIYVSRYKKKKNRFFLFTCYKSKKWSIFLDNKTSSVFSKESKIKRSRLKLTRFKKARVIRILQSNKVGSRRRRSLFKLRKQAFQFLDAEFKPISKLLKQLSSIKSNTGFERVSAAFYNNIAFLLYRLGIMGTFSACITAIKLNWFCLDFMPTSKYDRVVSFGSVVTLFPSAFVLSAFVWYKRFFIKTFFKRTLGNKHFLVANRPLFVFAFRKKYRSQVIYNKFELIKPFVLKNLKMR